jgi:SNF2 family DNA or RNA helicase
VYAQEQEEDQVLPLERVQLAPQLRPGESGPEVTFTGESSDGKRIELGAEQVVRAWQSGSYAVEGVDGGLAWLPQDWLERHGPILEQFVAARAAGGDKLPQWARPAAAALYQALDAPPPPELAGLAPLIDGFTEIPPATLPAGLQAVLRDYQRQGVDWLCLLRDAGIGALLADDMGLGKTLQTLCAITGRTLVIAPTSTLPNWSAELARFRPDLRVSLYHGPKRGLDPSADVTLTSYAVLRLDREALAAVTWDSLVLDEAQAIKEPTTATAIAAFSLPARWRVAMSGTPVENRLTELWSLSHFCNPGLLGGRKEFILRHARRIEAGQPRAAAELQARIRPFILRRRKSEVARELPARTDLVLRCTLDPQERTVYDSLRLATHAELASRLAAGLDTIEALELLLRLRQAACHLALVPGQQATRSSKQDLLLEHLTEHTGAGHRALVFSQWTGFLDLVGAALEAAKLPYVRLDGSTVDRGEVVARFQAQDGPPVMLVSLRAGGTGLNLTAADYVYLLDPWWNPAVEDQAADRSHRIGQERPVFVHRVVAEGTVEEKILELHARKRALADAAIEGISATALTREDLLELLQ